jgi:hypothetical protein
VIVILKKKPSISEGFFFVKLSEKYNGSFESHAAIGFQMKDNSAWQRGMSLDIPVFQKGHHETIITRNRNSSQP